MSADPSQADSYPPPDDETVNRAVQDYARAVRELYGDRVKGVYLFGSRARGDHTPDSDADIAVVLNDADWDFWTEFMRLSDLGYDILMESGADVQGRPVRLGECTNPQEHHNPELVRAMRADGVAVGPVP